MSPKNEGLRLRVKGFSFGVKGCRGFWVSCKDSILGGPFDLASRVSKVGYGDCNRVSRGY